MADEDRNSPSHNDDFMMSGAVGDEALGQDENPQAQAPNPVVQSIEPGDLPVADPLDGYHSAMPPPPPRGRLNSVASTLTDLNSPDVIASLMAPVRDGRGGSRASSALPSSTPRPLNLGRSVLNRRHGQTGNTQNIDRALSRQRDLATRLRTNYDEQAAAMTMSPMPPSRNERDRGRAPSAFAEALEAYETAQFRDQAPHLQHKHKRGKLNRHDEMDWLRLETRRRRQRENQYARGRSMTPAGGDDGYEEDRISVLFAEIKRIYDAKRRTNTATIEEEVEYMKVEAKEAKRLERQNTPMGGSRASTPGSNAGGPYSNGRNHQPGPDPFGGNRGKYPRQKYFFTSQQARKNAKAEFRAGRMPNRTDPRAAPKKGYGDDGRGKNIDFGDYFLKASVDEDPGDIEVYLGHVSSEVAREIEKKGVLPVYCGVPLKARLRKIRKTWNTKTKEFCRKYDLPPPPKGADDDEKRFNRLKHRTYERMRGGLLTLENASRFAVEANIEMCRWRSLYHQAIGNKRAATDLHDLDDVDLKLPTSDEFDTAYKPKYTKILELVGQMFAECQDHIRVNHDRLHTVFPMVQIVDPEEPDSSDEEDGEEDEETARDADAAAAEANAAKEKADERERADSANGAGSGAEDEDMDMFPENTV